CHTSSFSLDPLTFYSVFCFPLSVSYFSFFFFNDTATTEIYTFPYTTLFRSLVARDRDADLALLRVPALGLRPPTLAGSDGLRVGDRKSTRLNSSHDQISYAVFCLKKKKKKLQI